MMFKIAYGAGHYLYEAGKRLPAQLDKNQTREWTLNDRVARYFAEAARQYPDVQLLRVDEASGESWITLADRCAAANNWGADFCLAIHHNAGINLGSGGGIVAYSYPGSEKGAAYRDVIYDACIAAGGLRGNRSDPKATADFYVLRNTNAPAVLMEYGFMDSAADTPVILTEAYSKLVAYATMEGIAKAAGLEKRQTKSKVLPTLGRGAKGDFVYALQYLLKGLGYSLSADGDFGTQTESAVRAFQTDRGITADGIVGPDTWGKLLD